MPKRLAARCIVLTICLAGALGASLVQAAGSIVDLGKPSNDIISFLPLAGFRHAGPVLRSGKLPELLVIGTQEDPLSGSARWPIVKALDQFGRLTGVTASASTACRLASVAGTCFTSVPTFDWSHAHYASRYIAFVHRDLTDGAGHLYQRLSPAELALFYRYAAIRRQAYAQTVKATVENTDGTLRIGATDARKLPLVSIGGYLRIGVGPLTVGDFESTAALQSSPQPIPIIPFSTVQEALLRGKPGGAVTAMLLTDTNAEANALIALICHADGRKPAAVCGRSVIRQILRNAK
jgi:hypothetical protein